MAVTRLKRKGKRNIVKAKNKKKNIQRLKMVPVVRNVDVDAIKAEFAKKGTKPEKDTTSETVEKKSPAKAKSKPTQKKQS